VRRLDRAREYLLWYETHRRRWVAVPTTREGMLFDVEYALLVVLDLDGY
jgi:hypothetical protein